MSTLLIQIPPFNPELDIGDAPFSRRLHWLNLTTRSETGKHVIYLRTARGRVIHRTLLRLELETVDPLTSIELHVSAGSLKLCCPTGEVTLALTDSNSLRARLRGSVTLRLEVVDQPYSSSLECEPSRWHLNLNASRTRLMVTSLSGTMQVVAPFIANKSDTEPSLIRITAGDQGEAEVEITEFESTWLEPLARPALDEIIKEAEEEFTTWLEAFGKFPERWAGLARRAAYVLWANSVPAGGHYAHPAILMSQNAMANIWSWDHCFSALALAKSHPAQAWEQWWLPFPLQTPEGMLPDAFNDVSIDFGMTKPPVHGWALLHMLSNINLPHAQLVQARDALTRWTQWWLTYRDDDHDGIPQYNHGCESGWDNDSICSNGLPCEAPDLTVYLIQQCDALATLSTLLGESQKTRHWQQQADSLWETFKKHSCPDGNWLALKSGAHTVAQDGDCLRLFWPLLLGDRLSDEERKTLLAGLTEKGRFRTPYGYATEAVGSHRYCADGYWLGPIWAPSTFQVVEMLKINGCSEEANQTMHDFCELCEKSGFRENFDAQTGAGLRDCGYAWTAAVCLLFLQEN